MLVERREVKENEECLTLRTCKRAGAKGRWAMDLRQHRLRSGDTMRRLRMIRILSAVELGEILRSKIRSAVISMLLW